MVACKKCGKPFRTSVIVSDPDKTTPSDVPIQVLTCSHCGHQDMYGPSDYGFETK